MEKTQGQRATAVLNSCYEAAAAPKDYIRCSYLSFYYYIGAFPSSRDGGDPSTVLVAQWEVEQEILHVPNAVIGQRARKLGAYSTQLLYRNIGDATYHEITEAAGHR
jgi:hypothetical protein